MRYFLLLLLLSCGAKDDYEIVYPPNAYTFDEIKSACVKCHNASAPAIPLDESTFKASAKVKARIENGSMPPSPEGFDKARALQFFTGS